MISMLGSPNCPVPRRRGRAWPSPLGATRSIAERARRQSALKRGKPLQPAGVRPSLPGVRETDTTPGLWSWPPATMGCSAHGLSSCTGGRCFSQRMAFRQKPKSRGAMPIAAAPPLWPLRPTTLLYPMPGGTDPCWSLDLALCLVAMGDPIPSRRSTCSRSPWTRLRPALPGRRGPLGAGRTHRSGTPAERPA